MSGQSSVGRVIRTTAALWACEASLARLSSDRQPLDDLLVGALGLALCALPVLGLLRWARPGRGRELLLAASGAIAPAFLITGLLSPVLALGDPTRSALLVAGLSWSILAIAGALGAARGCSPLPSPAAAIGVLTLAALAAWFVGGGWPPATVTAAVALAFLASWALTLRVRLAPLCILGALGLALWPMPPPAVDWRPDETAATAATAAPDVILLTIDTLRADSAASMKAYQLLATRGTAFTDVQSAAPWTLPSFGTMLTGQPVAVHQAGTTQTGGHSGLVGSVQTLAERLRDAGYDTAAVVGRNPWLGSDHGFDAGFDVYDYAGALSVFALPRGPSTGSTARPFFTRVLMKAGLGGRRQLRSADELVDRAVHVVGQRRDRPLFLWVHFMDCHLPFRHATDFDLPRRHMVDLDGGDWSVQRIDGLPEEPFWPTAEGRALMLDAYHQEIALIDHHLQRLLAVVEASAGSRPQVIVLASDHGEELFDHGKQGHGHAFYQEVTTVPLVIAGLPGRAPGTVSDQSVHHLDLAPSLLAAAGLPHADLPGFDLAEDFAPPARITESVILSRYGLGGFAVRDGQWKAIFPGEGGAELYDLEADPGEEQDLASERPELVEALRERAPAPAMLVGEGTVQGDEVRDMLESLGYLE